ncbi:MAG: helix-turn-helix domain-containing protein [Armatimonadota bacterium]|nr:helix-turn-helix domain-containing protein [Armatimonadota bacterium]
MERRPTIMTVEEVARYLRVHAMTVYRLIQRGELPAVRVGRSWRFRKDQIDLWWDDREVNSGHNGERSPRVATPRRHGRGRR